MKTKQNKYCKCIYTASQEFLDAVEIWFSGPTIKEIVRGFDKK